MAVTALLRQHWAALRALLVLTVLTGLAYPVAIWLIAALPGLHQRAEGSIVTAGGTPVGSSLIGQAFTDPAGKPVPKYLQSRPSNAGTGYDPMASGASNLGPENIVDAPDKPSLLTQVCTRSRDAAALDRVSGARPFCTGGGVGAVLAVFGPRDATGGVAHPTDVISVNEPCADTPMPFLTSYAGTRVRCRAADADITAGLLVPVRGTAPADPQVPADAVTASGSGLDPDISPEYAALQADRIARARGVTTAQVRDVLAAHTAGRALGFLGAPRVNVLAVNLELDRRYPGG